nr:reverse transcriptase domain-containing protein [Tanacetum cinerariifolium]
MEEIRLRSKMEGRRSNRRRIPNIVEPEIQTIAEIVPLADRTMEELLQAPTEGYGEAIVILEILGENFQIKMNLLQLVQANKFHGFERDNPHTHISNFKRMTATLKHKDVSNDAIKLMLFPYSLEGATRIWDVVSKTDDRIDKLADQISNLVEIVNKQVIAPAKAVEKTCVTCGGAHAYYECIATDSNPSSFCAATGSFNQVSSPNELVTKFHHLVLLQCKIIQIGLIKGTLPSNTVSNPKGEIKAVPTRIGLAYEGPSIPTESPLEKVDEQNTKEILDKKHSNSSGSTAQVQPPVVPILIPKPNVLRTQKKPTIPYPSRLNEQKLREKATNQMEKFFQIFHDLHFDISFTDALLLMPKFASTIKSLLANKDKLFELAKVPLNENCSAMLLKKLPEKLRDSSKFLIPCDFPRMEVCHALADLGTSINLMPLSIWKKLSLSELTPTRMTLELADRSITHPKGVAEDVFFKVGKFHFPTDFVVVDFKADPRVPLILGRSFLRTGRALINIYGEEITLWVNDESITFMLNQTIRYSSTYDDTLYNPKSSSPTLVSENDSSKEPIVKSSSPTLTPFGESDFFLKEIEDFLNDDSIPTGIENSVYDPEGDILFLEKLLNEDPFQLPPMDLKLAEESKEKSFIEEPPELELKELPSHLEYAFLEDSNKLPVIIAKNLKVDEREALINVLNLWVSPIHCIPTKGGMTVVANENNELIPTRLVTGYFQIHIDPQDQEKITFTCPYGTFVYRRMPFGLCNAPVFGDSFLSCLTNLDKMLNRCEEMNLVLNWEKCHFMCREGIILGDKISKSGIEVDGAKVDVIAKLPHPTTVKGVRSFLGHAGSENLTADHLSRLENPHQDVLENKDINENFTLETLGSLTSHNTSWFSDIANFHTGNFIKKGLTSQQKKKFFKDLLKFSKLAMRDLLGAIMVPISQRRRGREKYLREMRCLRKYLTIDYLSKWVEVKALPTNDARVVVKFLISIFSRFDIPREIISDRRTLFCNDQFTRVMIKYVVTHRLATAYHPQTSG